MLCTDISAPYLFIFSENAPFLLYFSHIPTAFIALFLGFFVYSKTKNSVRDRAVGLLLLTISILFFVWSFMDIILWVSIDSNTISFVWSVINLVALLVSVFTLYFSYLFLEKKDVSLKCKTLVGSMIGLYLLLIPTTLNIVDFNHSICESEQGPLIYYFYILELLFFVWTSVYLLRKTLEAKDKNKKVVTYFSVGVICFLLSFSMANIIASITKYWDILHYGLFGMPIFMGFLIYLIVEYRLFNIRVLAARILVISIIVLIASQFFFIQTLINQVLTLITLLLVMAFGWWLIKSVEKEYKQKEELKLANAELKKLDQAKSDFINIASHQLRTPITVIQGVASMLIDGDIDRLPKEERQKFYESVWVKSRKLQTIINDILNATKIDNRVSEMDRVEEVNFCELLTKIVSDFELEAKERDIDLILDLPESPVSTIIGQKKYLEEAFVNLINNAIKYTPSSVMTSDVRKLRWNKARAKVLVTIREEEKEGKILIQVKDNGIGIPKESASSIFKKFSRANNAVEMYTDGSGLGLYIVKEIIEGHGGKIWFDSKVNHGTTFSVELPLKNEKISNVKNRILKEK